MDEYEQQQHEPRVWDDPPAIAWTEEEIAEIQYAARQSDTHE